MQLISVARETSSQPALPVSTFIFTTPLVTAVLISSLVEPEPPWKTKKLEYIEKFEKFRTRDANPPKLTVA